MNRRKNMKKYIRILAAVLTLILVAVLPLAACGTQQQSSTQQRIPVTLLSLTSMEEQANAVRDMLGEVGFDVKLNLVADVSTYFAQEKVHEYDIEMINWGTTTGNGDYAIRDLFHNEGQLNGSPIKDDTLSAMIDKAATLTYNESIQAYTDIENWLVEKNAYMVPLYAMNNYVAVYKSVIDPASIVVPKSTIQNWTTTRYVAPSQNETRPFVYGQSQTNPPSFDPLRTDEGSTITMNANMNITLVNLTADAQVTADGSLSQAYAIGKGNQSYYFILRDNVGFSKIENENAVDTGVKVGAEDVLFTVNRAKDVNSVPTNMGSTYLSTVSGVSIVDDVSELQGVNVADADMSVLDYFNSQVSTPISKLVTSKSQVNNAAGAYQVVRIDTSAPFPQLLNFLTNGTIGIVSEQAVTAMNKGIDANNYDANSQVLYGDISTLTKGSAKFNNQLWFSGPYALRYMDDYGVYFERNPAFMPDNEFAASIRNVTVKMINDKAAMVNALRSGDVDMALPTGINVQTCEQDPNLAVVSNSSDVVYYMTFNLSNSVMKDINLRKAVLYAINQDDVIKVVNGRGVRASSTLTMIPTGNVWNQDLNKAHEFMNTYLNGSEASNQ